MPNAILSRIAVFRLGSDPAQLGQPFVVLFSSGKSLYRKIINNKEKRVEKMLDSEWGKPLEELRILAALKLPDRNVTAAILDCQVHCNLLQFVWKRLNADYALYNKQQEPLNSLIKKDISQWSEKDVKEAFSSLSSGEANTLYQSLEIDYNDFFIYSKILMDKFAYAARLLISYNLPIRFSKQREYLLETQSPAKYDSEYIEYLRSNTDWFDTTLKFTRDKFIVHSLPFPSTAFTTNEKREVCLSRQTMDRDLTKTKARLSELRAKYEVSYPELKTAAYNPNPLFNDNPYVLATFFANNPQIKMVPSDQAVLKECLAIIGSDLPEISTLVQRIKSFVVFFGEHFLIRLQQQ